MARLSQLGWESGKAAERRMIEHGVCTEADYVVWNYQGFYRLLSISLLMAEAVCKKDQL